MRASRGIAAGGAGRALAVVATIAFGTLCLVFSDFVSGLQPVPERIGARLPLALATGLTLVLAGVGLSIGRTATPAALLLAGIHLSWATVLYLPLVAASKAVFGLTWIGCFENFALAGAMLALAAQPRSRSTHAAPDRVAARLAFLARPLYGVSLLVFGLAHFRYPDFVAALIPAWIPAKPFLAWFTGIAHFAAGAAVLAGIAARLACLWHAAMCLVIFALLHVPRVAADAGNRGEWTSLFVALALCGAALAFAGRFAARD